MTETQKTQITFGGIVATFGAILIALGIAWIIALNWTVMPQALKIVIMILATGTAYTAGIMLRTHDHEHVGNSLLVLGALLYTLSIFLIAQTFNQSPSFQETATLLLLAWAGITFAAYLFDHPASLVIALLEFLIWISLQFFAYVEFFRSDEFSIGILAIIYLLVGVGLYGLTQLHKSRGHKFFDIYRYWTAFYLLMLTYILSFQILLPNLWPDGFVIGGSVLFFLLIIGTISVVLAILGITQSVKHNKLSEKEVLGFVVLTVFYILLISLTSLFGDSEPFYRSSANLSTGLLLMWLFNNALFVLVILSVIGYGTHYKSQKIINLAILFFALDIITRYIGFIADFNGQISGAVLSIFGGIILLFGGWGIEHWRKQLISKTQSKQQSGYAIH